jgi:putative ABC transport system permease protein
MLGDLRYAIRLLRRSPGFAAIAILTLALGIGANTAVFSIVHGALLRPLPYREPGRLVAIWDHNVREGNLSKVFNSGDDFETWKRSAHSFEEMAAGTWAGGLSRTLTGRGAARQVLAMPVTESFFTLLGVSPSLGRAFTEGDRSRGCSVVVSHSFWNSVLAGDRGIVGGGLTLNRESCTVLGVMPPGFSFYPPKTDLWILLTPNFHPPIARTVVGVFGRLKPGVSAAEAQAELAALHDALHRADGKERNFTPIVYDLQEEFTWMAGRNLRTTLWVLLGAVGLVLLIACFNVANLLLGRALTRGRELAIRAAVGCTRGRLIRQLLVEGLVLATIGGVLGVLVSFEALRHFRRLNPVELPVGTELVISTPVLLFTGAVAILTALVFGLAPAWRASRSDLNQAMKSGSGLPAGLALGKALVAAEMALSMVLLTGAGLLIQSIVRMGSAPLGFEADRLYRTAVSLPEERYENVESRQRFFDVLEARLSSIPGIQDAALATSLPPHDGGTQGVEVFGSSITPDLTGHDVGVRAVTPGYFRTLNIALRRGRAFDARDRRESERVAIVDESFARIYFPDGDPIGKRIRVENPREPQPWLTVVGVVAGQRRSIVDQEMGWTSSPSLYRPLAQDTPRNAGIAVRAASDPAPAGRAIRREVETLDSELAVGELESVQRQFTEALAYPRFRGVVLGGFAVFALLLAAVGLYGVLGQLVAQRRREIGVRLALGARSADVARLVIAHGGIPVLAGVVLGMAGSAAIARFVTAFLYGVGPRDPVTMAVAAATLLAAAGMAIAVPARRATRTDPMQVLRQE